MLKLLLILILFSSYIFSDSRFSDIIKYTPSDTQKYIGTPSLIILPNGEYIASHDLFGPGANQYKSPKTYIYSSKNKGKSWKNISIIKPLLWGGMFMEGDNLYIIGTRHIYGDLLLYKSMDFGVSWGSPIVLKKGKFHCSSGSIIKANNILYKAVEIFNGGKWGDFNPQVISVDLNKPMTDPLNWKLVKNININDNITRLEGNMVKFKNTILNIMRTHFSGKDISSILELRNNELSVMYKTISMPGGGSKFTIRYDKVTKRYYSIVNKQTKPDAYRNNLVLIFSTDLIHWKIVTPLLFDINQKKYAWQYIDWQFENNDIVFVSRTSINNGEYKSKNAHDANLFTFHRIKNFRAINE